jgi:DNA mismatch repair protein PMS2
VWIPSLGHVLERRGAVMQAIKAIDRTSVHQITSGQVIVDLQTAVKELLENSFDAGATSVEVRFKEYGVNAVEIVDNGSGISESDYDSIGTFCLLFLS